MPKIRTGWWILIAGSFVFASGVFAQEINQARLDGEFSTQDVSQESDGANEVCFSFDDDDDVEVDGQVQNTNGGCLVTINYDTDAFTSASAKSLKPGQTAGTAKLAQSIFVDMGIKIEECLLDFVGEQSRRLGRSLNPADRSRLAQYFTSVRELEQRLHAAQDSEHRPKPTVEAKMPEDIADIMEFVRKSKLMYDLIALALQTDSTRDQTTSRRSTF